MLLLCIFCLLMFAFLCVLYLKVCCTLEKLGILVKFLPQGIFFLVLFGHKSQLPNGFEQKKQSQVVVLQ